ncbi:hypothetical protein RKE29_02890 [Streptomyces sp. B1866]|uniref:hypothetical protein n=1 Tax=Streptomyces sp. B1866 TaxID=3075431 RepID=UPI0028923514|nr:hypothetical protein [Streptomyces sp. B1866]MDT3395606.1 hypothetical protein [Streptomyces sp. B1866]
MTDPDELPRGRDVIKRLIKRDIPDRSGASTWCGKHPKSRTQLVLRTTWVCLDCVRESSKPVT